MWLRHRYRFKGIVQHFDFNTTERWLKTKGFAQINRIQCINYILLILKRSR